MFKQFQQNLDSSKTEHAKDQEEEVVLSLSSPKKKRPKENTSLNKKAKSKAKTAASGYGRYKKGSKKPDHKGGEQPEIETINVDSIDSLFDDMNESSDQNTNLGSVKPKPRKKVKGASEKDPLITIPPLTAKEVLTSHDLEPDQETKEEEAGLVLSAVKKSIKSKKYDEAVKTVRHWLQSDNTDSAPSEQVKNILLLKVECEIGLQNFNDAAKTGQLILKKYFTPIDDESLEQIEQWNEKFISAKKQEQALHFLFTTLNEYRIRNDDVKMDQIYMHIEAAYEQMEDWPRLIQTLQNHMGIKKNIKDFEGQLSLLDHLGKLLYDQGDAQGSKRCYEQSIAIKSQMVKA